MKTIIFEGETYRGDHDKLIGIFEGKGYAAIRAESNPHSCFQMSEHLKRSKRDRYEK